MTHNYNQILDGINDQIADLQAAKTSYEQQILSIQAELDRIPQQIAELELLKTATEGLANNAIDVNLNLNVTGTNLRTHSTPVGS